MEKHHLRLVALAYKDLLGNEDISSTDEFGVRDVEKSNLILIGIFGISEAAAPGLDEQFSRCNAQWIKNTAPNFLTLAFASNTFFITLFRYENDAGCSSTS